MASVPIVHSFSSVTHVWIPGAKTTGPIVKKFGFSFNKSNVYASENFKFQCDAFSNKKDVSQRSSCRQWGLSEMAYFIFLIFFNETWHIRRWA
jgi:hypothetical protein